MRYHLIPYVDNQHMPDTELANSEHWACTGQRRARGLSESASQCLLLPRTSHKRKTHWSENEDICLPIYGEIYIHTDIDRYRYMKKFNCLLA